MTELQKELELAFSCVSAIPVSGDYVEILAAAREHLRSAFKLAAAREEKEDG